MDSPIQNATYFSTLFAYLISSPFRKCPLIWDMALLGLGTWILQLRDNKTFDFCGGIISNPVANI